MGMDPEQIDAVARILSAWNPLGEQADEVADLDGYRTEAIDIIACVKHWPSVTATVRTVLNQAFNLSLDAPDCAAAAEKISAVLRANR